MTSADNEHDEFFRLIGVSITTWSGIESKLFRMFRHITGTEKQIAAILFFRTPSFSARVALVDELLNASLGQDNRRLSGSDKSILDDWETLHQNINNLSKFRNFLAHHQVSSRGAGGENWIEIHYKVNESWRGKKPTIQSMRLKDVQTHTTEVQELLEHAALFMRRIINRFPS